MDLKITKKGDGWSFEESILRRLIKEKDTEGIVAYFLVILGDLLLAEELVDLLRGGVQGPESLCKCGRPKIWVGKDKGKRWSCPDCMFDFLIKVKDKKNEKI